MIGRWLRWLFFPPATHIREGFTREAAWPAAARVATVCGIRVHPGRTALPWRPVLVPLAAYPAQTSAVPAERWVTCPGCRETEGWPMHAPAAGSGLP